MYKISSLIFIAIMFASCSNSFQYDVYVSNETGQNIKVEYRTNNAKSGVEEKTIVLKSGERNHLLISTGEIEKVDGQPMKDRSYCTRVASRISAFLESGAPIEKNWCDDKLKIETVDIGQAEYHIIYTKDDI